MSTSFITPGHVWALQAVTTMAFGQPQLLNCRINGEPGVVIVLMRQRDDDRIDVMPLFVAITESMELTFEGEGRDSHGGGGRAALSGPRQRLLVLCRR